MTDSAPILLVERPAPHVVLVTLNRPDARNAINAEMAKALDKAVRDIEADHDARVVVLTGAGGKVFCAGADLKEVAAGKVDDLWTAFGFAGFAGAERTKPWIAAVEGMALAGGCELVLACDIVVASEGGAFGLPEVLRGLCAAAGGLYRLPRAIPRVIATDLILTGERLGSERAAELGLVSRLVPAGQAVEAALGVAQVIAANAPLAVRESLAVIRKAPDLDDAALARLSLEAQGRLQVSHDFTEGAKAFVEKRAPVWTGR